MKHGMKIFLLITGFMLHMNQGVLSQGMPRSTGFGFRGGSWGLKDAEENTSFLHVAVSGFGGSLFFYSRFIEKWFLEISLGAVVNAEYSGSNAESAIMNPILLAARYDLLPINSASRFQPYLKAGVGTYLMQETSAGVGVTVSRDADFGIHAGCGTNILLASWLGFNADFRYHLVDRKSSAMENLNGFEFGFGLFFMVGKKREFFRIQDIKLIVQDIYPAYSQFYNTYPIAILTVRNMARHAIEVNVLSEIPGFTERPQESGFVQLEPGTVKDIPIFAIFGSKLMQVSMRETAAMDIKLEARAGASNTKSISKQIVIHNRNAWNGDIDKLAFFVTPDAEPILEISRRVTAAIQDMENGTKERFLAGAALFDEIGRLEMRYHRDPRIPFFSDDRVQFATESLDLKTGDCDDLSVLYSSLLESAGIRTAFVDVRNPDKEIAHVYLMFDTGIAPDQGQRISSNEKRYVVRESRDGRRTLWIPVETTLVKEGFEAAWKAAALQYLEEAILQNGLSEGWVKIIDID